MTDKFTHLLESLIAMKTANCCDNEHHNTEQDAALESAITTLRIYHEGLTDIADNPCTLDDTTYCNWADNVLTEAE